MAIASSLFFIVDLEEEGVLILPIPGERSNALEKLRDFHSSGFTVGDVNVATMRENEEYRREIEKTMTYTLLSLCYRPRRQVHLQSRSKVVLVD